ncbi:hypothetical protein L1887_62851 [Cichorium endivia]|nr:hypothetical protein L1887_62851 [Cichorium endivia]
MFEDAASNERVLERHSAFHVRATVVYGLGDRKQLVVDAASGSIVLCLSSLEQLEERLGCDVAVANQEAVDVKGGVQQRKTRLFVHLLVAVLRRTGLVAESQPAVRGVEQTGLGTSLDGAACLKRGDFGALARDAGNDGDTVVDRLDESLDHLDLLVLRQEGALTGVTEHNQTLDARQASEPRSEPLDGIVVHRAVLVEGGHGSRGDAAEVEVDVVDSHDRELVLDRVQLARLEGEDESEEIGYGEAWSDGLILTDSANRSRLFL